ncbi:hypothetical protein FDB75_16315 [Clostridium botulinum]|uniref:hypothetical protein n=1 Tax=Clostridium TaxID=1485 RepID=UPI0013C9665A|nr:MULTISPECIES: hypothetical protein [Clostridium]MCS6132264.1 hypothetical protein [Clostridium botulinum]NFL45668.1 hypothetical protein [Clostridium botulinum]NFL90565.1 hypothetical protein [Clostridium botulinum]NFN29944.1 hypothetical protein [Clostridium botulinum]NFO50291.1 hypothetical protein [Clostridium botulinum]
MRKFYLLYNLTASEIKEICPTAKVFSNCVLNHCKLVFNDGDITIKPSLNNKATITLWELSNEDESLLESFMGYRLLKRRTMIFKVAEEKVQLVRYI